MITDIVFTTAYVRVAIREDKRYGTATYAARIVALGERDPPPTQGVGESFIHVGAVHGDPHSFKLGCTAMAALINGSSFPLSLVKLMCCMLTSPTVSSSE
jgi:hypothetical protein